MNSHQINIFDFEKFKKKFNNPKSHNNQKSPKACKLEAKKPPLKNLDPNYNSISFFSDEQNQTTKKISNFKINLQKAKRSRKTKIETRDFEVYKNLKSKRKMMKCQNLPKQHSQHLPNTRQTFFQSFHSQKNNSKLKPHFFSSRKSRTSRLIPKHFNFLYRASEGYPNSHVKSHIFQYMRSNPAQKPKKLPLQNSFNHFPNLSTPSNRINQKFRNLKMKVERMISRERFMNSNSASQFEVTQRDFRSRKMLQTHQTAYLENLLRKKINEPRDRSETNIQSQMSRTLESRKSHSMLISSSRTIKGPLSVRRSRFVAPNLESSISLSGTIQKADLLYKIPHSPNNPNFSKLNRQNSFRPISETYSQLHTQQQNQSQLSKAIDSLQTPIRRSVNLLPKLKKIKNRRSNPDPSFNYPLANHLNKTQIITNKAQQQIPSHLLIDSPFLNENPTNLTNPNQKSSGFFFPNPPPHFHTHQTKKLNSKNNLNQEFEEYSIYMGNPELNISKSNLRSLNSQNQFKSELITNNKFEKSQKKVKNLKTQNTLEGISKTQSQSQLQSNLYPPLSICTSTLPQHFKKNILDLPSSQNFNQNSAKISNKSRFNFNFNQVNRLSNDSFSALSHISERKFDKNLQEIEKQSVSNLFPSSKQKKIFNSQNQKDFTQKSGFSLKNSQTPNPHFFKFENSKENQKNQIQKNFQYPFTILRNFFLVKSLQNKRNCFNCLISRFFRSFFFKIMNEFQPQLKKEKEFQFHLKSPKNESDFDKTIPKIGKRSYKTAFNNMKSEKSIKNSYYDLFIEEKYPQKEENNISPIINKKSTNLNQTSEFKKSLYKPNSNGTKKKTEPIKLLTQQPNMRRSARIRKKLLESKNTQSKTPNLEINPKPKQKKKRKKNSKSLEMLPNDPNVAKGVTCNCKMTKCLKMYCKCFAAQGVCSEACGCSNCCNTLGNPLRELAQKEVIAKNPKAFLKKFKPLKETDGGFLHSRGCKCKKTKCKKNYCECFAAGVRCSVLCQCQNCENDKLQMR